MRTSQVSNNHKVRIRRSTVVLWRRWCVLGPIYFKFETKTPQLERRKRNVPVRETRHFSQVQSKLPLSSCRHLRHSVYLLSHSLTCVSQRRPVCIVSYPALFLSLTFLTFWPSSCLSSSSTAAALLRRRLRSRRGTVPRNCNAYPSTTNTICVPPIHEFAVCWAQLLPTMASFMVGHRLRSLLCTSVALLMVTTPVGAFFPGVTTTSSMQPSRTAARGGRPSTAAAAAAASTNHALQRIWDELLAGAQLHEVEGRMMEVEPEFFAQASAWSKTFTPLRTVAAEVADNVSISVLVLPRELQYLRAGTLHEVDNNRSLHSDFLSLMPCEGFSTRDDPCNYLLSYM